MRNRCVVKRRAHTLPSVRDARTQLREPSADVHLCNNQLQSGESNVTFLRIQSPHLHRWHSSQQIKVHVLHSGAENESHTTLDKESQM